MCLAVMPEQQSFFKISLGQMIILCWALDMSFPVASIILSDYLPLELQGMAGSLVSTVINYSISLFLGISSTVEVEIHKKTDNTFQSYRAGIYFGVGVAVLGIFFSIAFLICQKNDIKGTFVNGIETNKDEDEEIHKQENYTESVTTTSEFEQVSSSEENSKAE